MDRKQVKEFLRLTLTTFNVSIILTPIYWVLISIFLPISGVFKITVFAIVAAYLSGCVYRHIHGKVKKKSEPKTKLEKFFHWFWVIWKTLINLFFLAIGGYIIILLFKFEFSAISGLMEWVIVLSLFLLGLYLFLLCPLYILLSKNLAEVKVFSNISKKINQLIPSWLDRIFNFIFSSLFWIIIVVLILAVLFIFVFLGRTGFPICSHDETNYDTTCLVDSDCKLKYTGCCGHACINKEEVEMGEASTYGMVPNVYALSCSQPTVSCGCINYRCVDIDYEDPPSADDCSHIQDNGERIKCYNNAASKFNDYNICFEINESSSRNGCLHEESIRKKEEDICHFINDSSYYDNCLIEVAKLTLDYNTCNNIKDSLIKDECVSFIAQNKNDSVSCGNIKDESEKNKCFSRVGKNLQDQDLCRSITKSSDEDNCLSVVAQSTNDFELCKTIKEITEKDKCIAIIAQQTRTIEYCESHSSLENCHYFFYQEHCDLLGEDIDLNNYNNDNFFVFKVMRGSTGEPYRCKEIGIRRHTCYPLDQDFYGECADEWRLYATTDSNGLVLANKSDFKLKDEVASVYNGHPRGYQYSLIIKSNNDQNLYEVSNWVYSGGYFRLENYDVKIISGYFCKTRGTGWDCWDPSFDHLKTK